MTTPTSVESYLAALPEESRAALEKLRKTIKAAAPKATEKIQLPDAGPRGQWSISCFIRSVQEPLSLFPASNAVMAALGEELKPYFSGKGTLRFTADKPIPTALVKKIVKARLEENAAPR